MSSRKRLVIGEASDLPLSISALLDMMRYVRQQTFAAVRGLSVEQLDHRHDEGANSIGSLLWHIASVEAWYQANSFDAREWDPEEEIRWGGGLHLGSGTKALHGRSLEFYVEMLESVRERTEREMRLRDEPWLLRVEPFEDVEANNYWKWFHVAEDEINHRGQIRWLRKRLP